MNLNKYHENAILGGRLYLVKEKKEDIPAALAFMNKMRLLDKTTKIIIGLWLAYTLLAYIDRTFF